MRMNKLIFIFLLAPIQFLTAQTSLPASWNFSNPGITSVPNGWTLMNTLPASTGVQTYGFGIGDALSCRFDAAGEYLIVHFADKPGPLSYYVSPQNAGNPWVGQFDVQQSDDGNTWSTLKSFTYAATTTTNFTGGKHTENNISASARFIRFMFTTKTSGNFALDSVLILSAPPPITPSINVKQSGNNIILASTYINGKSASTPFTIENKGTVQTLTISGISISGPDSADFSVNNVPASVNPLGNATFNLAFSPGSNGSRKAILHILSNDPDKSDYFFNLYGIGGNFASEPISAPTSIAVNNIKAYGFDVQLSAASNAPEHYIILRKQNNIAIDFPLDGTTYKKGDYIGNSQVAYIGDTVTSFKPTYIHANTGYSFVAFSFNGPAGFENYLTTGLASTYANTTGKNIGNYYSGIQGSNSNLISQLTSKINLHDTIYYSQYISRFVNPFLTRDTSNNKKIVNCVYTTIPQHYTEPFQWWNGSNGASLTREHTYPQSWMPSRSAPNWPNAANGREFPEYNDLHHLFPADQQYGNGVRSNYPLGEVVSNAQPSPSGIGKLGKDLNGATVWEPNDAHKGDAARALFYMCAAYHGINSLNWSLPPQQDQSVLKKWHFQDLPDNWEIARHEFIYAQQHNRNPFIDSVNFVCHIDFSNMSHISNPGVCGVKEKMLQIASPVGGEVFISFKPGASDSIKWISENIDSVKIDLFVADTFNQTIGNYKADSQKTYWQVPGNILSDKCKIKLSEINGNISSISPGYFFIGIYEGLENLQLASYIRLYPNPSTGLVRLEIPTGLTVNKISIKDITGKTIMHLNNKEEEFTISTSGIYLVELHTNHGFACKKLIVE